MVGSVITQTRSSTPFLDYKYVLKDGRVWSQGVIAPGTNGPYDGKQTTTSYRSTSAVGVAKEYQQAMDEILTRGHAGNTYSQPYDTGHEFTTTKMEHLLSHKRVSWTNSDGNTYTGPLLCAGVTSRDTRWVQPPLDNLVVRGTEAIKRTVPTSPAAGLSTFLGELREGFPSMLGASLAGRWDSIPKKLGGEYLNYQFGWLPLISDLKKFLLAAQNSTRIFEQYSRDSGRQVRRRYHFPDDHFAYDPVATTPTLGNGILDGFDYSSVGRLGTSTRTTTTRRRTWFSGSYTYYLEQGSDILSRLKYYEQQANHLLGTRITPEVLWELAPWSWLADWYVDIGSIISNASAFQQDKLVLRYGYLMQTSITDVVYRHADIPSPKGMWTPGSVVETFRYTRKERIRATPYGFGLSTAAFTPQKWAILGALGMTKAPGILR